MWPLKTPYGYTTFITTHPGKVKECSGDENKLVDLIKSRSQQLRVETLTLKRQRMHLVICMMKIQDIRRNLPSHHYNDVIMGPIASQITSLTIVYSSVYSDADQRKHQSSASLAFVRGIHRGPVNSPHKWPVTRKMFPFDDVIMTTLHLSQNLKKLPGFISLHLTGAFRTPTWISTSKEVILCASFLVGDNDFIMSKVMSVLGHFHIAYMVNIHFEGSCLVWVIALVGDNELIVSKVMSVLGHSHIAYTAIA